MVEYPGYGIYKGTTNEETILRDAETVFDHLVEYSKIDPDHIIVMGKSLGTGPASHLGAHRNPRAVILITPFTSIRNCMMDIVGSLMRYIAKD